MSHGAAREFPTTPSAPVTQTPHTSRTGSAGGPVQKPSGNTKNT